MLLTTGKYAGEQERSVQCKKLWEVNMANNMANNMADAGVYNCACLFLGAFHIVIKLLIHPLSQDTHDATPRAQFPF